MRPCSEPPFELKLSANAVFTIDDADGVGIECRAGSVWITLDNDIRDIVLSAGERYCHDGHRRALLFALAAATIEVRCARPAAVPATRSPRPRWHWPRFGRRAPGPVPA